MHGRTELKAAVRPTENRGAAKGMIGRRSGELGIIQSKSIRVELVLSWLVLGQDILKTKTEEIRVELC